MAATPVSDSTRTPSGATPPARCSRPNESTSRAVAQISPAGPAERGSTHCGARCGFSPFSDTCPYAARYRIASSGSVTVRSRPRGSISRSRSTSSQLFPRSRSTSRPAITNPVLQYENVAPTGCENPSVAHPATYFSTQSSPRPTSSKWSPWMPLVWVRRCRTVTFAVCPASPSRSSGSSSTTG
jgi:hypothetical protein